MLEDFPLGDERFRAQLLEKLTEYTDWNERMRDFFFKNKHEALLMNRKFY